MTQGGQLQEAAKMDSERRATPDEIMDSLGAEEAVNLDGGGSTSVTIGKRLVNRPSDASGERPIGDAVVLLP